MKEAAKRERGRPFKAIVKTTTPPQNDNYYTVEEACLLLGIHRHTLQARLRDKTLKGKMIGRTWRIYKDEIFDNSEYLYHFDCMDGVFGDQYFTPSQCNQLANGKDAPLPESSIISIAKNLEATLYRCKTVNDSHGVCIYDCMDL